MRRHAGIRVLISALLLSSIVMPAYAALPPSASPQVIYQDGFEAPGGPVLVEKLSTPIGEPETSAYWGRVTQTKSAGAYGLWCAGTPVPTVGVFSWPTYNIGTRGFARLNADLLADYYSSKLSFDYLMPSLGAAEIDNPSFFVRWDDTSDGDVVYDSRTPSLAAAYTPTTYSLTSATTVNLSRTPGDIIFEFYDRVEGPAQLPVTGQGPSIDQVVVSGYKYGPVRSLAAAPQATQVQLSWSPPYRSTVESVADTRTVTYRVWRSVLGSDAWQELTVARLATASFNDTNVSEGFTYQYLVQAWDAGVGTGYGEPVFAQATVPGIPPSPPSVTSNAAGPYSDQTTITITATAQGSPVQSVSYRLDGGTTVTVQASSALVPVKATATPNRQLQFWATNVAGNSSTPQTANFVVNDTTAPVAQVDFTTGAVFAGSATIAISATDSGSGVKEVWYKLDNEATQTVAGSSTSLTVSTPKAGYQLRFGAKDLANNASVPVGQPYLFTVNAAPAVAERVQGASRYDVAVQMASAAFPGWSGVKDVIIASGEDRAAADPLAAAGLVWRYGGPLLLVNSSSTPKAVLDAIDAIVAANGPITLRVVGGTTSVPAARIAEIKARVGSSNAVEDRIVPNGGRFELASSIANRVDDASAGLPPAVLIANGADSTKFFDALALSAISARIGAPILLVQQNAVPAQTQARLDGYQALDPAIPVIIGGGPATVSESVRIQVGGIRWSGPDRFSTATTIADRAYQRGWLDKTPVGVAAKLPDALSGGAFVGRSGGPLLLTQPTTLSAPTSTWLTANRAAVRDAYVFGGTASLSQSVQNQVTAALAY